jgi:hypothetical protein
MPTLGYIGEKLDLLVKQGSTLGPFQVTLKNEDSTPFSLSGMTIRGHIRRKALDAVKVAELSVVMTNPAAGEFEFGMSDETTAAIPAGETVKDANSIYVWDMEREDSSGRVYPMYHGECKVFREVTRV